MKFWTLQKRDILEKVLNDGCYQPDFSQSSYVKRIKHLDMLYDLVLDSFNRNNHTNLPGLLFAFTATDNQYIYDIPDIDAFVAYICDHAGAIKSLWNTLIKDNVVIMELEYADNFNPIYIDINDFQFLMPPYVPLPPYSQNDPLRLLNLLSSGQVMPSVCYSGIMQAHLPWIRPENLVATYEVFPLE
jgi:hypothetical protein